MLCKHGVAGSNPTTSTPWRLTLSSRPLFCLAAPFPSPSPAVRHPPKRPFSWTNRPFALAIHAWGLVSGGPGRHRRPPPALPHTAFTSQAPPSRGWHVASCCPIPPFCAGATETPASMLMAGLSLREWRFCTLFAKGYGKYTFYGQVSGTDEGAGPGSGPERAGIPAGDPVGFGLFCPGCPDRQGADSCTEG